jgi:hypothetical protein
MKVIRNSMLKIHEAQQMSEFPYLLEEFGDEEMGIYRAQRVQCINKCAKTHNS